EPVLPIMAARAELSRRRLLRWASWFAVANAALLALIGLRYLWLYARLSPSVAWGYAPVAYVGHVTALAYLPCLVVLMPVSCCVHGRAWWCRSGSRWARPGRAC